MFLPSIVVNKIATEDYFDILMEAIQIIYETSLLISGPIQNKHNDFLRRSIIRGYNIIIYLLNISYLSIDWESSKYGNCSSDNLSRISWSTSSKTRGTWEVRGVKRSFNSGNVLPFIQDFTLAVRLFPEFEELVAWSLLVFVK